MSRAVILTDFGAPSVLQPGTVELGAPAANQIRVAVRFAGVGPTDLAIRSGHLRGVFPAFPGSVLGFEAAGVVDAVGSEVTDVKPGDDVAVFLPGLGGYAEHVLADFWGHKPSGVAWETAAAAPAAGEAAVRVLNQLEVRAGEKLLVLGGAGSVGTVAVQLAVARGVTVIAAVRRADFEAVRSMGAIPVEYGADLAEQVRSVAGQVDAVLDAAPTSDLKVAAELAGGPQRVITLTNPTAEQIGARLSGPIPAGIPAALAEVMNALSDGRLVLRPHTVVPLTDAAEVHAGMEAGTRRTKTVLAI